MKSYLNAKLILFKEILNKKLQLYQIKKFSHSLNLINSKKKNLKIIDISKQLEKIKKFTNIQLMIIK